MVELIENYPSTTTEYLAVISYLLVTHTAHCTVTYSIQINLKYKWQCCERARVNRQIYVDQTGVVCMWKEAWWMCISTQCPGISLYMMSFTTW